MFNKEDVVRVSTGGNTLIGVINDMLRDFYIRDDVKTIIVKRQSETCSVMLNRESDGWKRTDKTTFTKEEMLENGWGTWEDSWAKGCEAEREFYWIRKERRIAYEKEVEEIANNEEICKDHPVDWHSNLKRFRSMKTPEQIAEMEDE